MSLPKSSILEQTRSNAKGILNLSIAFKIDDGKLKYIVNHFIASDK